MEASYQNKQDLLARQFHLNELSVSRASQETLLAIRQLKFIERIPLVDKRIIKWTEDVLKQAVFCYVTAEELLQEEDFFSFTIMN